MTTKIDYYHQEKQMGDLLIYMGVSIENDFSEKERELLRKQLEHYMMCCSDKMIEIDLKKFVLQLKGIDEVGNLYEYVQ